MEKSFLLRRILFFGIVLFLLSPFLYILGYIQFDKIAWDPALITVILGAFIQSLLSTGVTLLFGVLGAFGLIPLKRIFSEWAFHIISLFIVLPSFLPPLIVITLGAHTIGFLPMGLGGVVFFHSLMNIGLVALLFFRILYKFSPGWLELAITEGVSLKKFILKGVLPELSHDIFRLGFYFMVLYFFSFSIPLILGGPYYGGLEVFIYEQIVILGNWGEAIQYSFALFLLILLCSFLLKGSDEKINMVSVGDEAILARLKTLALVFFAVAPVLFLSIGFFHGLLSSIFWVDVSTWWEPMRGTLIVGLSTGAILFVLFSLMAFSFLNHRFSQFFMSLVHPGWVIVGFSFLLMPGNYESLIFLKLSLALSILYVPYLFRLSFYQGIKEIRSQVMVAQVFPVTWAKIYCEIIFPQMLKPICFISGLGGLWACGDFAISGVLISSSNMTSLSLDMKNLISNYRLEQALLLLLPLLISSFVVFTVFQGLYCVSRRKV